MQKVFQLVQILQNLNQIKRTGGNLFMGLPAEFNVSIAEHSYAVAYLSMLFVDALADSKGVDRSRLLKHCLIHDWTDCVLGDLSSGSPSWASFWDTDIKKEVKNAERNVLKGMMELVKDEINISDYQDVELGKAEKNIFKAADIAAMLFEMLEWKYAGFKHDGWEMVWFNTVDRLAKIDLVFIPSLVSEFKKAYKKNQKPRNTFLAQSDKQTNPEHQ